MRGSPALSVQLTPGGSGQGLEVPRIADFTHRPGLEPATGDEPAPNFLLSQWDHGSRPALPAPKVRENLMLASMARYGVLILVVLSALSTLGVQTTSVLAALGAAGLAIGLALQGTLANIAAGLMLLFP